MHHASRTQAETLARITHCYARLRQICMGRSFAYAAAIEHCAELRRLAFAIGDCGTANLAGLARGQLEKLKACGDRAADAAAVSLLTALDEARACAEKATFSAFADSTAS